MCDNGACVIKMLMTGRKTASIDFSDMFPRKNDGEGRQDEGTKVRRKERMQEERNEGPREERSEKARAHAIFILIEAHFEV